MKITTIRHGETDWNAARKIQGHTDIPLNAVGLNQAERLAARLADEPCDAIFTSDLLRARKTAEIINTHHNAPLIASFNLRERNCGEFEGQLLSDPDIRAAFFVYLDATVNMYFPKIHAELEKILSGGYKNIFIVGHYGTAMAILYGLLQIPAEERGRYTIGNTAINAFEIGSDDKFFLSLENDTAHLL
ncbi:MAG: histidine phosphatase family protein [Defluviitaleaceae bacterium]|nr:histidine phosphatase family protein [Defluviitaleaceae bacterium]